MGMPDKDGTWNEAAQTPSSDVSKDYADVTTQMTSKDAPKFDLSKKQLPESPLLDFTKKVTPDKALAVAPTSATVVKPPGDVNQMMLGLSERGIGIDQVLNHMGVGGYVPVYANGKIKLGLPSDKELANEEKNLESWEGGGVKGWAQRQAGDPLTYLAGPEKWGIAAKGALQSGVSSLLGAS